jgi:hypothetical protein
MIGAQHPDCLQERETTFAHYQTAEKKDTDLSGRSFPERMRIVKTRAFYTGRHDGTLDAKAVLRKSLCGRRNAHDGIKLPQSRPALPGKQTAG